jgi:enoyl-[acyl-carrier protein] reductase II
MNRISDLFKIKYPIIQAGMIWCSGWELASAVSNAGGLGLIGAGSMEPELLKQHIRKCKVATNKPFGINIPLLYASAEEMIQIMLEEGVKIIFTSAGNPAKWTPFLKEKGMTVVHVIANTKFAIKCQEVGVDAIVAEGFEAGGHNGKEETTTMVLIPSVKEVVTVPIIAAGGISSGRSMLAAFALGAEGVQIGSRFVASVESSAHPDFKQKIIDSKDGDTMLMLKKLVPVRLLRNKVFEEIQKMENEGASPEKLLEFVGKGRPRSGMFDGVIDEGELEIGQVAGIINTILPAGEIVREIMQKFNKIKSELSSIDELV